MDTKKLRQKILDLAIHGKLVPQDPNDEPASVLLERIRKEKEQLIKEGKIKAPKKSKSAGDTSHYPKEVPWELPEGWCWTTIDFISESILYGVSESAKTSGEYKLLRITDIQNGRVDWTTVPFADYDCSKVNQYILRDCDILFARTGATVGKSYLSTSTPSNAIYASYLIRVRPNSMLSPQYVKYYFESGYYWEQISINSVGVGQSNVNGSALGGLIIPIPPIAEQKRIVREAAKFLRLVDILEVERETLTGALSRIKEHVLDLAIHGKLVPQDPSDEPAIELLKRINPDFQPSDNLHYGDKLPKGWSCAEYGKINQHKNKAENPMSSPDSTFELYSVPIYETGRPEYLTGKEIGSTKQQVSKGDVLLCKINPHLNRVWVVSHFHTELKCIASSEWLIFQSDALLPEYARTFFMSPDFRSLMLSNVSGVGGSLMRARGSAIESYPIWIPPIKEQKRIVDCANAYYNILEEIAAGIK